MNAKLRMGRYEIKRATANGLFTFSLQFVLQKRVPYQLLKMRHIILELKYMYNLYEI